YDRVLPTFPTLRSSDLASPFLRSNVRFESTASIAFAISSTALAGAVASILKPDSLSTITAGPPRSRHITGRAAAMASMHAHPPRSEEHTSELQSRENIV